MGRPKSAKNAELPPNLYVKADGYFWYRDPVSKSTVGIGRDKKAAISYARQQNSNYSRSRASIDSASVGRAATARVFDKDGLVEIEFLRKHCAEQEKVCGIYFLMHLGEVVYVGQSTNCLGRISTHILEGQKVFNFYYIIRTDAESLTELEMLYIRKFKPKYNVATVSISRTSAWGLPQDCRTGSG